MVLDAETIDAAAADAAFSGVVAVHTGEELTFARTYGFAHRALRSPITPETRFAIASGGKMFTALAVMRLVADGALRLSDPVRPVLGSDLPLIDDAVTVEHLLGHTSGIGDYLDENADWEVDDYVLTRPVHELDRTEAFLPLLDGHPQAFAPGERFAYCNGGYVVLALVAERVSGREFHDLVEQEVCARAGLARTGFPRTDSLPGDVALGYLDAEGDRCNVLHLPVRATGDGGIVTSAADVHAFWRAFTAGRIVPPGLAAEMIRPRHDVPDERMRYGLGVWLHRTGPQLVLDGYDAGCSFRSTHDAASDTTVSVLGNTSDGAWPVLRAIGDAPFDVAA